MGEVRKAPTKTKSEVDRPRSGGAEEGFQLKPELKLLFTPEPPSQVKMVASAGVGMARTAAGTIAERRRAVVMAVRCGMDVG